MPETSERRAGRSIIQYQLKGPTWNVTQARLAAVRVHRNLSGTERKGNYGTQKPKQGTPPRWNQAKEGV